MLASVYGPQSTAARKEDPEKMVVEVLFKQQTRSVGKRGLSPCYIHAVQWFWPVMARPAVWWIRV